MEGGKAAYHGKPAQSPSCYTKVTGGIISFRPHCPIFKVTTTGSVSFEHRWTEVELTRTVFYCSDTKKSHWPVNLKIKASVIAIRFERGNLCRTAIWKKRLNSNASHQPKILNYIPKRLMFTRSPISSWKSNWLTLAATLLRSTSPATPSLVRIVSKIGTVTLFVLFLETINKKTQFNCE